MNENSAVVPGKEEDEFVSEISLPPAITSADSQEDQTIPLPIGLIAARTEQICARLRISCAAEIATLKVALDKYHAVNCELRESALLPGEKDRQIREADELIGFISDRETVEDLLRKKMRLAQISNGATLHATRMLTIEFFKLEGPILELKKAVAEHLKKVEAEFVAAEVEFFESFGLPHEPTQLSKNVQKCFDRINDSMVHWDNLAAILVSGRGINRVPNFGREFAAWLLKG